MRVWVCEGFFNRTPRTPPPISGSRKRYQCGACCLVILSTRSHHLPDQLSPGAIAPTCLFLTAVSTLKLAPELDLHGGQHAAGQSGEQGALCCLYWPLLLLLWRKEAPVRFLLQSLTAESENPRPQEVLLLVGTGSVLILI